MGLIDRLVVQSDCVEFMKTLSESSVDAVVTDPPYALGFMGKEWDSFGDTGRGSRTRVERKDEVTSTGVGHQSSKGPFLAVGVDSLRSSGPKYGDSGGASRFFYCSKASTKERSAGLDMRNPHPTVKPVDLMRWLVRLITPPDGLVLDPFCGSGTTGVAAVHEGFRFVGVEQDAEYCRVARERIEHEAREISDAVAA